jgi:quercetin dioxygenase-like cupin family protein
VDGVRMKTLVYGEKTLFTEFLLQSGHTLPLHAHEQEQTGYLVSGSIRLFIGQDAFEAGPGDSWCIPGGVEHGAEILADAVAIEVFSPLREDYLPKTVR